jgi:peptide/nickel transport system substrate-binding protein
MPEGIPTGDSGITQVARQLTTDGLIQLSAEGRVEARAAQVWRWENDGLQLRVTLEPGIVMHDGRPLTPAVVAAILTTATQRASNKALYPSFNYLTAITPDGDRDLVLRLSERSSFLPEDLEIPLEIGNPPVSTGPFRIVRSGPNEIVLEPFARYRGGRPHVGNVVIKPFPALRTAWASLLRGDIDVVTEVPPDAVEFVQSSDVNVLSFSRRYQYLIAFNNHRGPFQLPAVRKALNLAIDREALIRRVLQGRGTPSTGPLWPNYWAYDRSLGAVAFDPRQAEMLLDAAGLPRGHVAIHGDAGPARFRFTCLVPSNFALWERIALEVQKNLYAIGVDMQFKVVPFEQFDGLIRQGQFDAAIIDMISGPTPGRAYLFWRSARESKGLNVFGYEDREAERLFTVLRTSMNDAATRSATQRLQRVFLEDPPALFLAWNERARAVRREFVIPNDTGRDPVLSLWQWTRTIGGSPAE